MKPRWSGRTDSITVIAFVSLAFILLPILTVIYFGFFVYRSPLGFSRQVFLSISLTLVSASISAVLIFIVFTPLAYALARKEGRLSEAISDIPASIPHPIVGIAFLIIGSPITPFGRFLSDHGLGLYDSFLGLLLVLSFISAPIYVRSAQSLFASIDRAPEEFAMTLGKARLYVLYGIIIPSNLRSVFSSILTSMSRAISEFGSVAILVFYIIGGPFNGTETASVLIYQYYGYYGPGAAVTASALLIIISVAILIAMKAIGSGAFMKTEVKH